MPLTRVRKLMDELVSSCRIFSSLCNFPVVKNSSIFFSNFCSYSRQFLCFRSTLYFVWVLWYHRCCFSVSMSVMPPLRVSCGAFRLLMAARAREPRRAHRPGRPPLPALRRRRDSLRERDQPSGGEASATG